MGKKLLFICLFTSPFLAFTQEDLEPFLSLSIEGSPRMITTNPAGERTGSQGFEVYQEANETELVLRSEEESISYTNPALGEYEVVIRGNYNEDYTFTMAWYDGERYREQTFRGWISKDSQQNFSFTIEQSDDGWEITSPVFGAPNVSIYKDNNRVQLEWSPSTFHDSYTVYSKKKGEPYFTLVATTTDSFLVTDTAWAEEGFSEFAPEGVVYFAVVGRLRADTQTFFSPLVNNADEDSDGYNDFREEVLGTDPKQSDSDSDGLSDFAEVNRWYSHPLNQDTDSDGYTDGEEVELGTLPNQEGSTPEEEAECEVPGSGDWLVESDCVVSEDQTVPGDIIVYPNSLLEVMQGVTLWFDYLEHKILVMFGGGLELRKGASINQEVK